jgi:hypothetical protein
MVRQLNGTAIIKRVRIGIQVILWMILFSLLYINHEWLLQIAKNNF